MHTSIATVLVEVGAILLALGLLGRLARVVHIPVVLVYLVAGLFFGQGGFVDFRSSTDFLHICSDIGVVLLLLMLGMEYSADELRSSLRTQAPMGLVDCVLNAAPGVVVALAAGWGALTAVALGGITWASSSGVIAKMLGDSGRLGSPEVPSLLGVLVIEDLMMAVYLPLLTALLVGGHASKVLTAVLIAVGVVGVILYVATRWGHAVSALVKTDDQESLLLGVLGLTLLVAGLADQIKVSAAVGAFLVGIALSETVSKAAHTVLAPLRDLFAAAFFVTFGLSTDSGTLWPMVPLALLMVVLTAATKIGTGWLAARRARVLGNTARWRAGVALIPRGEFSVIIATLAVAGGVEKKLTSLTAAYVLLTIALAAGLQKLPENLLSRRRSAPARPEQH